MLLILIGLLQGLNAQADVKFVTSDMAKSYEDEQYPESSFGSKPADPVSGRRPASASASADGSMASGTEGAPTSVAVETGQTNKLEEIIPDAQKGTQEVALIASETGFYPQTLFVTRGVPVRLFVTGASKANLCVMVDSFDVKKQVRFNRVEEITFMPKFSGQFRVHCPMTGMEGTLVVKEGPIAQTNTRSVAAEHPAHGSK